MGVRPFSIFIVFMFSSPAVFSCPPGVEMLDGAEETGEVAGVEAAVGCSCEKHCSHSWPEPSM